MVDDGTWSRIERAIVASYDQTSEALVGGGVKALPEAARLVEGSVEGLQHMLHGLGIEP